MEPPADPSPREIPPCRRRRRRRRWSIRHLPQRDRSAVRNIWPSWPDTLVQEYPKYEQHRITRGTRERHFPKCVREPRIAPKR